MSGTGRKGSRDERMRFVLWAALSALGLGVGLAVSLGLATPLQAVVGMMLVTPITLTLAGSMLGASQALAIPRMDRRGFRWVVATALGLGLGMTAGIVTLEGIGRFLTGETLRLVGLSPSLRFVGLGFVGVVTGVIVGLAQRLATLPLRLRKRGWVLASVLGFGLGLPGGGLAADLLAGGLRNPLGFGIFLGASGLLMGLITAKAALRFIVVPESGSRPTISMG